MSDVEKTEGDDDGAEMDQPTEVDAPVEEDDTSPEGMPAESDVTGVQAVDESSDEQKKPPADGEVADDGEDAAGGAAEDEEEEDPPPQARLIHNPPQSMPWRIARLLAAPILAGIAFGVHMWLNVPDDPVIQQLRDQGAKERKKGRPRPARRQKMAPRSAEEMDEVYAEWSGQAFEDEPPNGRWPRDMQTMINKAVVVARKAAFDGAPEEPQVFVTGTECRTIRCRFVLKSPFEHEIQLLGKAIEKVQYDGQPMWRSFEMQEIEPPTEQSPKDDHYVEVIVAIQQDGYEAALIEFVDESREGGEPEPDEEEPEPDEEEPNDDGGPNEGGAEEPED